MGPFRLSFASILGEMISLGDCLCAAVRARLGAETITAMIRTAQLIDSNAIS
jgi:hypothetical protein